MLVYYCGDLMTWHFEGVLVMSKTTSLNPLRINQISTALEAIDLTFDDLCVLNPEKECSNAPAPFPPYSNFELM